jgi:hypothetical protein
MKRRLIVVMMALTGAAGCAADSATHTASTGTRTVTGPG